jgi:hypothetical protein
VPASARSLRITDTYRQRLQVLRRRSMLTARDNWQRIDAADLDGSGERWAASTAAILTSFQRAGGQFSLAYLTAYLRSELGRVVPAPPVPEIRAGTSRDGRLLSEALFPAILTTKQALGDGRELQAALELGLNRALRTASEETVASARDSLADTIRQDGRILGWRRVSGGGCGACDAAATGAIQADDEALEVHPFCSCSKEPVVADAPDTIQRPTGEEMFNAKTPQEQDAMLGPDKAALIRSGEVPFTDLIQRDPMAVVPDGITEAPLEALKQ